MKNVRDPLDVAFGKGLRARRGAARLSLEELGRRIGVTYQQIQKYETGANRVAVSTAARLATALDCSVADLFAPVVNDEPRSTSARSLRVASLLDRLPQSVAENFEALIESTIDARTAAQLSEPVGASLRAH